MPTGEPDASLSTVIADKTRCKADGTEVVNVTVQLWDEFGAPCFEVGVNLHTSANGTGVTIDGDAATDGDGIARYTVTCDTIHTVGAETTLEATADGPVTIAQTVDVEFYGTFAATPSALNATIRPHGGAYTPADVRAVTASPEIATLPLIATSTPTPGGFIGLAVVDTPEWVTVPALLSPGVAGDVEIDASGLRAGNHEATLRLTATGYDPLDVPLHVAVRPQGAKP